MIIITNIIAITKSCWINKLHTLSIIETCDFNGFRTFQAFMLNLNAKLFLRMLTANKRTDLYNTLLNIVLMIDSQNTLNIMTQQEDHSESMNDDFIELLSNHFRLFELNGNETKTSVRQVRKTKAQMLV